MQAPSRPPCIPYSRSAAALPLRIKEGPRKQLFRKFSSLSLFDRKPSAHKWHQQINRTANGLRPVTGHNEDFVLFPWAQLRLHTDDYLRRLKLEDTERDATIRGLISNHEDKVIALAACAHRLSQQALLEVLADFTNQSYRDEDYLQAFVAASHGHGQTLSAGDAAWATTLVTVCQKESIIRSAASILKELAVQFSWTPLPKNPQLRSKLPGLIIPFLQRLNTALADCQSQQDWTTAVDIAQVLASIEDRVEGTAQELEAFLQSEIPTWRHWAAWRPNHDRIKTWHRLSRDWLRPFWNLLGPNFDYVDGVHVSNLSKIIRDGGFVAWLGSQCITPGPGLLFNDTPDAMTAFSSELLATIDIVCTEGGLAADFFWHLWLDDRLGLDQHALHLWELARKCLFERAPTFLSRLLQGASGGDDPTSTIAIGLCALGNEAYKDLRVYLSDDILHLIAEATVGLRTRVLTDLQSEQDWFPSGSAMVYFRSTIARFPWLYALESESPLLKSETIISHESIVALQDLHRVLQWPDDSLEPIARAYIGSVILGQTAEQDAGLSIIENLHALWQRPEYKSHRSAALVMAHLKDVPAAHRATCIADMITFTDRQAKKLEDAMIGLKYKSEIMCHCIVRLVAKAIRKSSPSKASWMALCRHVLETYNISPRYAVSEKSMTRCGFKKYRNWVQNLHCIFGDLVEDVDEAMDWVENLNQFKHTLDVIGDIDDFRLAIHCIYTSYRAVFASHIIKMLWSIERTTEKSRLELMYHVVLSFTEKSLAKQMSETLCLLSSISDAGFNKCRELVVLSDKESIYIASVQLQVWMQDDSMADDTKKALKHLGEALHLPASSQAAIAKDYFLKRVTTAMKCAHEIDGLRVYLKATDRVGVATVITNLGLEDPTSPLEEEMTDLPNELLNFLEQVDDSTVELQFPLAGLKDLQRNAMGLKRNESLVVRLTVDTSGTRESFCVHTIDSDTDWDNTKHDPIKVWQKSPSRHTCENKRHTRLGYVIMRSSWQKLRDTERVSLADIYRDVEATIKMFGRKCLVCNEDMGAYLYKPTTCKKAACRSTYLFSDLQIRLSDLYSNEKSVGLLLAAVQAAALAMSSGAASTAIDLLPDRPPRLSDNRKLITMLDTIPSIPTFTNTLKDLDSIRIKHSIRHELLFSWVLNVYQGFIVEANGPLRIPNMPNVLQFVLADSPPEITAAFAKHDQVQPRQVLFHGTSMERLFAILCQGLKILSQTSLQAHGNVHGNGIYLAEEPSLAVSYSRAMQRRSSTFSMQHAEFVNKKVLLGIEYAGVDGKKGNGIVVATDPTKLLLRYIFLLPQGFKAPIATHLVPAMQSNFHSLRAGARSG